MSVAVLFPRFDHPAIEERYASWQSDMLLRRQATEFHYYDRDEPARDVMEDVHAGHVLVITDPLLVPSPDLVVRLTAALGDADAAVPMTNEAAHPAQRVTPATPYATLQELYGSMAAHARTNSAVEQVEWDGSDPGAYLSRAALLAAEKQHLRNALAGRRVAVSKGDFVHRWSSMRGQVRQDLLDRVSTDAKSILEFGCGEGELGAALKARQRCRMVGVELDSAAAAVARKRIDDVYCGDVREIVALIHEQFDWIIGGDIVEHLDEPWSFLADLRRISTPGGHLLLSLPNIANASVVADLLKGRFDYVYMGLLCVGHLRFFTRSSIEDMFSIAGWASTEITPQAALTTPASTRLLETLAASGVQFSRDDLTTPGYYVIARNR
ncbi:MAG TPA: class I SAM-dependent methyltransferase [Thermoanaerobaculia bacterium]|nr:class I SAM-dependent methyltransferase [Thermoanaerobaculia bacterium]